MADPVTANIGLAQPTRGSDTGVWDTPVNNNMSILDLCMGGSASIPLNNANVILSAAQFQSQFIVFSSTLTGSVTITFPTSFTKSYVIFHGCTGSSANTITLATTAAGGHVVGCPPQEAFEVINDGTNIIFKNFDRIGSYWDHCGSSVPNWVPACSIPPYLNCDGTSFSSATYPLLSIYMGGTTLPDLRGRARGYLNQGTGRMTSGGGGVDGNTLTAGGGLETTTLSSIHVPRVLITDPGHTHTWSPTNGNALFINNTAGGNPASGAGLATTAATGTNATNTTGISAGNASPSAFPNMPPMAVGGITMIRAG